MTLLARDQGSWKNGWQSPVDILGTGLEVGSNKWEAMIHDRFVISQILSSERVDGRYKLRDQ